MDPALIERLRPFAEILHTTPGQVLVWEGAGQNCLFLVVTGKVVATKKVRGDMESMLAELGPGTLFGELGAIDPGPAAATVTAEGRCVVWRFPRASVERILADRSLVWPLLRSLSAKVRGANQRLGEAVAWSLAATALDPTG